MAFAKQYFSSYKSNNNLDYYLELWVENFDSSATEISIGAGGPVISYETDQEDRFSPILSSQCELPFVVKNTSLQAFIQQLRTTYKERQVYLHLYRATSSTYTTTKPIWSGFLVMDLGSGEDVSFPYEQKLTFVDGLSLLKDIDFVDLSDTSTPAGSTIPLNERIQGNYDRLNMYYGPAVYTFWIKEILAKAGVAISGVDGQGVSIDYGFTTAVNWYNADMQNTNQGSDPLGLTQCVVSMFHNKNDQDVFTPENCYTVLKELLRHWGARITYWKHEFWIVQIPEYIQDESGLIDNPDNINSRQYNRFGTLLGSQDHLGDTYYTRYEQTIQSNQVSKLVGTKYNYLPMIHNAEADFLSFASKNYYGGFPYGVSAESQEIFQGTIIDPSTANFLWLSIPLNWTWDMTGSSLTAGHENGWWCSVRFNFYASDGTTTYYLQYDSSGQGSYYWVLEADWTPLGNTSPKYIIKSRSLTETNYIGFQENIPFVDSSGSAITMTGAWSFFLDIEDFANQSSSGNNGSFYCRFSGYAPSSFYDYVKKDPYQEFPYLPTTSDVSGGGPQTKSGTVRWSNTLENPSGITTTSFSTPAGFDAGTSQADIQLITTSPFKGLLQTLNTTQTSSFGLSLNTQVNNSTNTEKFSFGTLLWGDAIQQFAVGCLRVNNGTAFVKTNPDGEWGRGTLTGDNTFTELLIDEFLSGQIKVVIAPTMRLAVGEENKNQTATGTSGPATRPRYVNPIGRLREFRSNETDPEYIFRRGSFHSLYDEWDYEGYQILRDTVSSTTTTTDIGDLGGTQDNKPISNAKMIGNVNNALMMNSPVAYLRTTVPATGSNVAVNGNFNTAVGWTLGTGWSIDTTAKKAKFAATGSTSELTQSVLTQGLTYQVNFQVVVTAGTLLVKAGTSGTSQSITTSGDYSLYLDCDGSNLIKFQAGTTFTGNITYITLRDQKSISSVPINSIGSTVFKSGDTFNLINSLGGEILPLTVSSNQGATDDTISVTSTALFDDIGIDSILLINQDDLSAQYQNKTKGTVAGFDITATGIAKSSINITDWLNSDTMSGAAVTNVPTALSVKNYVDGQVGASDTLQEVTDNGNTTTNSITFAGGTSTAQLYGTSIQLGSGTTNERIRVYYSDGSYMTMRGYGLEMNRVSSYIRPTSTNTTDLYIGNQTLSFSQLEMNATIHKFANGTAEKMRITSAGNVLIGTTTDYGKKLYVNGDFQATGESFFGFFDNISNNSRMRDNLKLFYNTSRTFGIYGNASKIAIYGNSTDMFSFDTSGNATLTGSLTGTTATFSSGVVVLGTLNVGGSYFNVGGGYGAVGLSVDSNGNLQTNGDVTIDGSLTGTTATFSGQVTIPATPVATTDAASKSYVDAQVSATDSLQEVTTVGNTTTNSVNIGSATSPAKKLTVTTSTTGDGILGITTDGEEWLQLQNDNSTTFPVATLRMYYGATSTVKITALSSEMKLGDIQNKMTFFTASAERMRLTSDGKLLLNTTSSITNELFQVDGSGYFSSHIYVQGGVRLPDSVGASPSLTFNNDTTIGLSRYTTNTILITGDLRAGNVLLTGSLTGTTATFTDQVTIPATPVASTDAASKGYVDTQVGSADTLAEVLANGNTTGGTNISVNDTDKITFGASADLEIYHDGNNSYISDNGSGNLIILADAALQFISNSVGRTWMNLISNGSVDIFYNGSKKFATTNTGISITGGGVFTGQVTIPATPVASTDAASKSYVDAQVSATDSLQEVTTVGNTTTNSIRIGSSSAPASGVGLQVDSIMRVDASGGIATQKIRSSYFSPSSNLTLESGTSANIIFGDNTAERMRLTSGGNLLIGTTTDSGLYKLDVNGNINTNSVISITSTGIGVIGAIGNTANDINIYSTSSGHNGLRFHINGILPTDNSGTIIDNDADLGDPNYRFKNLYLGGSLTGTTASFSGDILPASNIGSSLGSSSKSFLYTYAYFLQSAGILQLGAGGSEKARITSDGKLGIGTTSPSDKLQVQDGYIRVAYTGGAAFKLVPHSSNDGYGFYDAVNLNFDMWFDGGNVGIGTTSPATNLHLATSTSGGLPSFIIQDNARSGSSALNYLMFTDSLNATQAKIGFLSGLNTEFTLQNFSRKF